MPQQEMYEVEAVLSERGSGASHEYQVKWIGFVGTTWEPAASILEQVPLLVRRLHGRPPDVGMWVVVYREWPASTTDRARIYMALPANALAHIYMWQTTPLLVYHYIARPANVLAHVYMLYMTLATPWKT